MTTLPDRRRGVILALLGVLILSPDGVLTTMIGADLWTTLFWRGTLVTLALLVIVAVRNRGDVIGAFRANGWAGVWIGLLYAASSYGFVISVRLSTVADTLFIISAAPLLAALLSSVLGTPVSRRTWLTIGVAIAGMAVIFGGKLEFSQLSGVLTALGTAIAWGVMLVVLERVHLDDPAPAWGIGAVLIAVPSGLLAPTLALAPADYLPAALLGLVFLPAAFILIGRAPRYLPAPEVGLIVLLEAVFGPLLAFVLIAQTPSSATLAGGAIILSAMAVHFSVELRRVGAST